MAKAKKLDNVPVVKGRIIRVENQGRKFGAAVVYNAIQVEDANGKNERCLLFTPHQIRMAELRAQRNKEDLTEKGFFRDALD